MALRNVGVDSLYIAIALLFLPRSLNVLFRSQYFMNLFLMTKYTLSTEFVLAQVRGNNHWRTVRHTGMVIDTETNNYHCFNFMEELYF